MPTVLQKNGFSFKIYFNDHEPAHTHIFKQGELVVNLGDENTSVSVRDNFGMSKQDERRALIIAGDYQDYLLKCWRDING
jgi:hypothetical protein